jgi:1-acyl-sn-glycerol-3-phosphate acyltransferase/MFS family permease
MDSNRWKLVSLWVAQTARVTADNALRFFVCWEYAYSAGDSDAHKNTAYYLVNAIFTIPAVFFAPFNGAICNALPKSRVLRWSAFYAFLVMAAFAFLQQHWITCWALISIGSAIYGPTRYAMLPAAAVDTRWTLPRINAFIEMGTFAAILLGLILIVGTDLRTTILFEHYNAVTLLVFALTGIAWLASLPVAFPSDLQREEPPLQAVRGFFTDLRVIWNTKEARTCLIGLSGKRGLIIGMSGAMLAMLFHNRIDLMEVARITCWVAAGVIAGSLFVSLQKHPRRVLGMVPLGATGLTIGLAYVAGGDRPDEWLCALVGMAAGLINVPLAATYQADVPDDARGNAMAVRNLTDYLCATVAAIGLALLGHYANFDPPRQIALLAAIAGLATLAAWWIFRREFLEQILEIAFQVLYRIRAAGPGLDRIPLKGPVLVVVNHSGYPDPMWLAKVLPRAITPMMTSFFYDHWLVRWVLQTFTDVIRVEASGFRREVPEIQAAIDALDAGKCVLIFPEGRLRRTQEQPLRMFGQGVWHILRERPNTPVVVCWLEGGWGSYFSYWNGPPTVNKKIDIRRPIDIAVGEPQVLNAEVLADHRTTRRYLMEQCGQMRKWLGLEAIEVGSASQGEEEVVA